MAAYKLSESLLRRETALGSLSNLLVPSNSRGANPKRATTPFSTPQSQSHGSKQHTQFTSTIVLSRDKLQSLAILETLLLEANCPYICVNTAQWRYIVSPAHRVWRHQGVVLKEQLRLDLISIPQAITYPQSSITELGIPLFRGGTTVCNHGNSHVTSTDDTTLIVPEHQRTTRNYVATPPPPPAEKGRDSGDRPSPAQLSVILLKMREELPAFFDGHHTFSMYAPNLIFTNNLLPLSCKLYSRWSYRSFLATTSALLRLSCAQLNLDLLRITKDVDRGRVEARWRLRGRPRYRIRERVILDGYSEFLVNSEGTISHHHMDCIMPIQQKERAVEPVLSAP